VHATSYKYIPSPPTSVLIHFRLRLHACCMPHRTSTSLRHPYLPARFQICYQCSPVHHHPRLHACHIVQVHPCHIIQVHPFHIVQVHPFATDICSSAFNQSCAHATSYVYT
jgi:hypothetical protein